MTPFVSLCNRTHFSLLHSLVSPRDLFVKAKELGQSAIAITDYGTLTGSWDAMKASKETGVKLIIGCEFCFIDQVAQDLKGVKLRSLVLLAKNAIGYKNLLSLTKYGFENSFVGSKRPIPIIDWSLLEKYREGLICLTGGGNGIIGQFINVKKFDEAEKTIEHLKRLFNDDLGLEVQAHHLTRPGSNFFDPINQIFTNAQVIRLAKKFDVRIVPTTNTLYLKRDDALVHDVALAIGAMQPAYSNARIKYNVQDMCLKSGDEVRAFFARNYTDEVAKVMCDNTLYFANRCEDPIWINPMYENPGKKELPVFPIHEDKHYGDFKVWLERQSDELKRLDDDKNYLRFKCEMLLKQKTPIGKEKEYRDRLEEELDTLYYCGVSSYMLIVADILNWARNNGVQVGSGRGSVGGSLVAYLLGIHKADPIKYGLVFARFHNKLKASYSDIDFDVAKTQRDRVLHYLVEKYGKDNFAQITNIIYITPKVYARDISRACEFGGDRKMAVKIGNDIADIIPKQGGNGREIRSYKDLVDNAPLFNLYVEKYKELAKYQAICGKPRANGIHASGIVISQRPLHTIVPLRMDKDHITSVQYDKDRSEEAGLVKIDVLGLETLDIIEQTNTLIKEAGKSLPTIDYDEYDKKTYDLITSGDTLGVFQFGMSAGTIDLCKKVKPKSVEDLAVITALARPVSKGIRSDFIKVRDGKIKHKLLHSSLENALKHTLGFLLYDESLLLIAKDVAGWDLAEADKLRKLTKEKGKNPAKAEQWRQEFIQGAVKNGIDQNMAMRIWDDVVSPAGTYAFNKSHAILYSMISYHTAYLKAHYPIEFLLANLIYENRSSTPSAETNIDKIKNEFKALGVKILPPDINSSDMTYKLLPDGSLLTGFEALKFVGRDAIMDIIQKRPFKSFDDFMRRCSSKFVRANTIQALAASGCLDGFNIPRKLMFLYCSDYRKKLQTWTKKTSNQFEYPWPAENEWAISELYPLEKFYLGSTFTCDKTNSYGGFFNQQSVSIKDIRKMENRANVASFRVEIKDLHEFKVKKLTSKYLGKDMVKLLVEDSVGDQITLTIFPDRWGDISKRIRASKKLKKFELGVALHCSGTVNVYEDEVGVILDQLFEFLPIPAMPKDLKTRKTSMPKAMNENELNKVDLNDIGHTISMIEDQLVFEGLVELEEDDEFELPAYK